MHIFWFLFGKHVLKFNLLSQSTQERPDRELENYAEWSLQARLPQIRHMMIFTSILYLLYAYLEHTMQLQYATERFCLHAIVIPCSLFFVYRLSFFPRYFPLMRFILAIAPIIAVFTNLYLNLGYPSFTTFSPEIYLNTIWTFTMSGLTLRYSLASVLSSFLITVTMTYSRSIEAPIFYAHYLWLFSSFVFGLVSSIILEQVHRSLFKQQRDLLHSASVDSLTGLWNRSKLIRTFDQHIAHSTNNTVYSLLILDIDHFKSVNDQFGHVVGDKVLVQFAHILSRQLGKIGQVCRFGGEEFCVLLPDIGQAQAQLLAESLLMAINRTEFESVGRKSASIGLTQYRWNDTFESFLARADKALYQAKYQGRNNVKVA